MRAPRGHDAVAAVAVADLRPLGSEDDVAAEKELETPRDCSAVHGADHRYGKILDALQDLQIEAQRVEQLPLVGAEGLIELDQVPAG